jgi:putative salt-induced outer membrane protein YdiY
MHSLANLMKTSEHRGLFLLAIALLCLFAGPQTASGQYFGSGTLPPPLPPGTDPNSLQAYEELADMPEMIDYKVLDALEQTLSPVGTGGIAEALAAPLPEVSPIEEQHQVWYRTYPWMWTPWSGWTNSIELGLNGSQGNSETTSLQAGADLQRITDYYTFAIDIDYQKTEASGAQTQNNGRINFDYDRLIGESSWSAFSKLGLEYDEFKAFDLRINLNGGLGYYWLRNDNTTLVTRFGAGASREIGAPVEEWVAEAVFGYEASHQLTERQKIKGKLEYFPEWADFGNYRLVSDVSWEILLDGVDNLSLKLAATNRYDSTPQGAKPNDLFYSALLLYKF